MASKIDPEPDFHENLKTSILTTIYSTLDMLAMLKITHFGSPEPQENTKKTSFQKTFKKTSQNDIQTRFLSVLSENVRKLK